MGKGAYAVEVDIMQPIDVNKSPKVHEPKLNHIGLWVDDIHKAVEWLTTKGVRLLPVESVKVRQDMTYVLFILKETKNFRIPPKVYS